MSISRTIFPFIESSYELIKWFSFFLKNENFKNYIDKKEQQKELAILGNGPSMKQFKLDEVSGMDCCMVNFSPLSDLFFQVRPRHYVIVDDAFFTGGQKNLPECISKVDWNMSMYVPYKYRRQAVSIYGGNKSIDIIFVHTAGLPDEFAFKRLEYKLFAKGRAVPVLQNVMAASIFCMINAGYTGIHLYGADHSWITQLIVDEQSRLCLRNEHYYDSSEPSFEPLLLPDGTVSSISHELREQAKAFGAYEVLQGYADFLGNVSITNKTKGSYIDAFKK
jgi:hypothetical protein